MSDRKCLGCSEDFDGGVHAFMCGTCTWKLLDDGIIVKREDLQFLFDWIFEDTYDEHNWDKAKRIKEVYGIK